MLILGYPLGDVTIGLFKLPSRFGLAVKLPGLARLAICLNRGGKIPCSSQRRLSWFTGEGGSAHGD